MNIPNVMTIARIVAVPVTIWLIVTGNMLAAFWVFVLAGITDGIDGYLARRLNQQTEIGAYLDAAADKALLVSVYLTLAVTGDIPLWLALLVISRDIMIVGAVIISWLVAQPLTISPFFISKLNTAAQIVFAAMVLADRGFAVSLEHLVTAGMWSVAVLTIGSAAAYLVLWVRHTAGFEEKQG